MTAELIDNSNIRERLAAEISVMGIEQLREELTQGLQRTAHDLLRLSLIVRKLEERGEDLSSLRSGFLPYLRKIAYDQLLPEVVVRFAGSPSLINHVSSLPIPEQRQLAAGEPVKMLVVTDGKVDHRLVDPLNLTRDQLRQIFARDHIRDDAEQRNILEDFSRRRPSKAKQKPKGKVKPDLARGGIVVGRVFVTIGEVLEAIAQVHGGVPPIEDDETSVVPMKVSKAEHTAMKILAAKSDCTLTELVRRALYATGVTRGEE